MLGETQENDRTQWSFETTHQVASSPTIVDETVFIGTNSAVDSEIEESVYALDASSGQEIWSFSAGQRVPSAPAVANGTVFVGSGDGHVYALNATNGGEAWSFDTGTRINCAPTVADGTVVIANVDGQVYALDAASGDYLWVFETDGIDQLQARPPEKIISSPTVANGTVFIMSAAGVLYALNLSTGVKTWSANFDDLSTQSFSRGPKTGLLTGRENNAYIHDVENEMGISFLQSRLSSRASPTVVDSTVFAVSQGTIYAVEASEGDEIWSVDISGSTNNSVGNKEISFLKHSDGPRRKKRDGTSITPLQVSYETRSSPTVLDGTVFVVGEADIYALDAASGDEIWSTGLDSEAASSPTVADGTVFVPTYDILYALRAATGEDVWTSDIGPGTGSSPTVVDGTLFIGRADSLLALDAGVSGSSEGSRVRLRTLGHHDKSNIPRGDGDSTPTATPVRTRSPTLTPTDYDFQEARQEVQVQPLKRDLLVLTGIPNADGKPAVTTTEYEIVDTDTARDAFVTFTHGQSGTGFDWESQLEYARTMLTKHGMAEVWSQAANIGWDALAAYAMAQINPAAGIGPTIEALQDSTAWALQEATDPYMEAMSKQTQWTQTYRSLEGDISRAESLTDMTETMFGFLSTANSLYDHVDDLSSVVSAARSAYQASNSFTTAAAAGTAATTSAVYYAAIGILVSEGVGLITSGFEQNAKLSAIGHAYSTTRIPVIERIIELENERTANTLSPGGAWELAYLTMNHHYMGAFANQGMYKYASNINQSTVGGVWDALVNVGEVASVLNERASNFQWGGAAAHHDYGGRMQRATNLTQNSINLEINGSPTPLEGDQ